MQRLRPLGEISAWADGATVKYRDLAAEVPENGSMETGYTYADAGVAPMILSH
jgi:hypothetical protein